MTMSVSGGRPTTDAYTPRRLRGSRGSAAAVAGPVDRDDANRPPGERHPRVGLHGRPPERPPRRNDAHALSGVHLVAHDAAAAVDDGVPLHDAPSDLNPRARRSRPVEPAECERRTLRRARSDTHLERA